MTIISYGMEGRVIDVFKNYVKVQTPRGEKIVKIKGRKNLPSKGWILELKRSDPEAPFVGSIVVDSLSTLPPLKEAIPIIEAIPSSDPYEITFFAQLTRSISARLGYLPKDFYKSLGEYYRKGETASSGIVSQMVVKILKEKSVDFKVARKKDPMRIFGRWLNTFSHPYRFKSFQGYKRPVRFFGRYTGSSFMVRIDALTKEHGRVIVEGEIGKTSAKLKVVPENVIESEKIEDLKKKLERIVGNVFLVQGGKGLGFYV